MKLPPAMLELFMRSAGMPPAAVQLIRKIEAEGFNAFAVQPIAPDHPGWANFGETNRTLTGYTLKAQSPTSRAVIMVFLEGVNDEIFEGVSALGGDPSHGPARLPASV